MDPPQLDPITHYIAVSCERPSAWMGYEIKLIENDHLNYEDSADEQTYDSLLFDGRYAISIEEGCNGISIMILFIAFVIAFKGKFLNTIIFIPAGIVFIHVANLIRLSLLSYLNVEWNAEAFHFFHKYGFTAIIYGAVLILWYLWISRYNGRKA